MTFATPMEVPHQWRGKKFVCVCAWGHCRSVALSRALINVGLESVAVGYQKSPSALIALCEWADYVLVLDERFSSHIPAIHQHKVLMDFAVGNDVWWRGLHPDLSAKCRANVKRVMGLSYSGPDV